MHKFKKEKIKNFKYINAINSARMSIQNVREGKNLDEKYIIEVRPSDNQDLNSVFNVDAMFTTNRINDEQPQKKMASTPMAFSTPQIQNQFNLPQISLKIND